MTAVVETYELAPGYSISRVIRGGWQLAGGHGAIDRERAVDDLIAAFDAGVFTFDCADIYTGVEGTLWRDEGAAHRDARRQVGELPARAYEARARPFNSADNRTTRCRSYHRPLAPPAEDGAD